MLGVQTFPPLRNAGRSEVSTASSILAPFSIAASAGPSDSSLAAMLAACKSTPLHHLPPLSESEKKILYEAFPGVSRAFSSSPLNDSALRGASEAIVRDWLGEKLTNSRWVTLIEAIKKLAEGADHTALRRSEALELLGLDRATLQQAGLPPSCVNRLYRSLWVFSVGFHEMCAELLHHTRRNDSARILGAVWKVFTILLEDFNQHQQKDYLMAAIGIEQVSQLALGALELKFQQKLELKARIERQSQEEVNRLAAMLKQAQIELRAALELKDSLHAQISHLEAERLESDSLVSDLKRQLWTTSNLLNKTAGALESAQRSAASVQVQLQAEISLLNQENAQLKGNLDSEINANESLIASADSRRSAQASEMEYFKQENHSLKQELEKLRSNTPQALVLKSGEILTATAFMEILEARDAGKEEIARMKKNLQSHQESLEDSQKNLEMETQRRIRTEAAVEVLRSQRRALALQVAAGAHRGESAESVAGIPPIIFQLPAHLENLIETCKQASESEALADSASELLDFPPASEFSPAKNSPLVEAAALATREFHAAEKKILTLQTRVKTLKAERAAEVAQTATMSKQLEDQRISLRRLQRSLTEKETAVELKIEENRESGKKFLAIISGLTEENSALKSECDVRSRAQQEAAIQARKYQAEIERLSATAEFQKKIQGNTSGNDIENHPSFITIKEENTLLQEKNRQLEENLQRLEKERRHEAAERGIYRVSLEQAPAKEEMTRLRAEKAAELAKAQAGWDGERIRLEQKISSLEKFLEKISKEKDKAEQKAGQTGQTKPQTPAEGQGRRSSFSSSSTRMPTTPTLTLPSPPAQGNPPAIHSPSTVPSHQASGISHPAAVSPSPPLTPGPLGLIFPLSSVVKPSATSGDTSSDEDDEPPNFARPHKPSQPLVKPSPRTGKGRQPN